MVAKLSLFFVLLISFSSAQAVTIEELFITASKCVMTAAESTTGSTIVGGGVGAVAGGILGGMIFGRTGAAVGAGLGGATGGAIGHASGEKAYHCKIAVDRQGVSHLLEVMSDRKLHTGFKYKFQIVNDKPVDVF